MDYLYVLQSLKDYGYYIGITDKIEQKIKEHNQGKTKSLKHRLPFILKYIKNYHKRKELLNKIGFDLK